MNTQEVEVPVSNVEHAAGAVTAGDEVTVNPDRVAPPLLAGTAQLMVADVAEVVATAVPMVGAPGVPRVIELDDADEAPVPLVFLAATVKV